jgi:RpiR family carbohydrate utilization transcriptional regulator
MARQNGAGVIAITDPQVELANIATVFFSCDRLEDTSVYTPMSSRLAQLALLDALYVTYALALGETATENLLRSKDALMR